MSASAQGSPCPACHALGFIPRYTAGAMMEGTITICPACDGEKYVASAAPSRALLGICANCKQEINIVGGPPCLPEYPYHMIPSILPTSKDEAPSE